MDNVSERSTAAPSMVAANVAGRGFFAKDVSPRFLLLALLLGISCYYINLARDSYMDDFRAFYVASEAVHDHLDPYASHVDVSEKYTDALWLRRDSRFIYPPPALFFVEPLAYLPYKWSKIAFGSLMTLTMVGILFALHGRYPRQTLPILALFLTLPMFMNIDNGNIDILILALTLAAFYRGDSAASGVLLGLAIAIKFAPLLTLGWFLAERRWRTSVWSVVTSGGLAVAAWARWGSLPFREFLDHLIHHASEGMPTLDYTLQTVHKIQDRVIVTTDGLFSYQHDIGGYAQNPLRVLGHWGGMIGLAMLAAFLVWLRFSRAGRGLTAEQSFFSFLVVSLFANHLLWAMALVACFPLTIELIDRSRASNLAAVLLLVPLFLTKQVVGQQNFLLWLLCAGVCVFGIRTCARTSPTRAHEAEALPTV